MRLLALQGVSRRRHHACAHQRWDTVPICSRLDVVLSDLGISSSPPLETQKEAYTYFSEVLYPFDWIEFLCRRARQTFPNICMSELDLRASMLYIVSLLKDQRPVLSLAWLRFILHSVPTYVRLHDEGYPHCPWCSCRNIGVLHVLTYCEFEAVLSFTDLGPKWRKLQAYLDFHTAGRLSGEGATALLLGLHLPYDEQCAHFPFRHLGAHKASSLSFQ